MTKTMLTRQFNLELQLEAANEDKRLENIESKKDKKWFAISGVVVAILTATANILVAFVTPEQPIAAEVVLTVTAVGILVASVAYLIYVLKHR